MRAGMAPLLVSLLTPLTGCFNHAEDGKDDTGGVGSGELENVTATINPVIPTVIDMSWDAPAGGVSHVEYGLDGLLDKSTPVSGSDTHFEFNLLGLKTARSYSFQAVTVTEDGTELRSEVGSLTLDVQPQGLPLFAVDEANTDLAQTLNGGDGYVMFSIMQLADSWVVIVDRDGDYVWYLQADDGLSIPTTHTTPEKDAIVYTQNDRMQKSDLGGIVRITLAGEKTLTVTPGGHHDAIKLPGEDTIAYINVETDTFDVEDHGNLLVAYDNVYETPIGAVDDSEAEQIWSLSSRYSDYPRDPWYVCSHFNAEAYSTGGKDWTHSNSLMASDDGEFLYIMSKNLDAIWKIDRQTRTFEWQMGGEDSDFRFSDFNGTFAESPDHWSHAHMSDLSSDSLCLFDNGYHHDEDSTGGGVRSRVVDYSYDESTMEVTKTWEMWLDDDYFNPELGDCRRMPNGNHLISVTVAGYIFEVAPDNSVVWKVKTDEPNAITGRVTYLSDLYALTQE